MSEQAQTDPYVTVKQAAEIAHVSKRTVERWIEKGALTVRRSPIGNKLLLLRSEVEPQ